MPRFTYEPSSSSAAARAAICSRVSGISGLQLLALRLVGLARLDGALLDPLLDVLANGNDTLDVDTGQVDLVRVQLTRLDQLLHLRDRDPAGHRGERVEVPRAAVEDQVAVDVALERVHQAEVGDDRLLQHVRRAVDLPRLLRLRGLRDRAVGVVLLRQPALGDLGADPGRRVERGDPAAAGPQLLGQRALRRQLDLQLTGQELPGELLVLPDVRRSHLGDPLVREQDAESPVVDAAVVRHDAQPGPPLVVQRADQLHRIAAQPETSDREARAVPDVRHRFLRRPVRLVHQLLRCSVSADSLPTLTSRAARRDVAGTTTPPGDIPRSHPQVCRQTTARQAEASEAFSAASSWRASKWASSCCEVARTSDRWARAAARLPEPRAVRARPILAAATVSGKSACSPTARARL